MAKRVKPIDLLKEKLDMYLSNPTIVMQTHGWTKKQYTKEVAEMQEEVELSNKGKRSKRKGSSYERDIAKKFKAKFNLELVRTPQSGGFQKKQESNLKGDIVSIDPKIDFKLHIECKNHKTWALPSWIRQAEGDCPKGKIPIVIYHRGRKLENGDTGKVVQEAGDYVSIPLEDFLEVLDESKIIVKKGRLKRA